MGDFIVGILNYLIEGLGEILTFIGQILPPSPIKALDNSPIADYLSSINYFIPLDYMVSSGEAWLVAIGIYYGVQTVLRWIKSVD